MPFTPPPKQNTALLVQQGCGPYERLLDESEAHHAAYAQAHGMDYWPVRERFTFDESRHPNWDCLALLIQAANAGYEWVFWLDADAVVWDTGADLRDALPAGKSLGMVCEDRSADRQAEGPHAGEPFFNAGAMYLHVSDDLRWMLAAAWLRHPHGSGQYEQGAINLGLSALGDAFLPLAADWNWCPRIFSPSPRPVVLAFHGEGLDERLSHVRAAVLSSRHLTAAPVLTDNPLLTDAPVLSVQVAVHGGPEDILLCTLHVLAHTRTPFRLRLWDNGSDPLTAALLASLAARCPCVSLTVSAENVGFGAAHNALLTDPEGEPCEVTCILNSDCFVGAGWDAEPVALLRADPCLGAAGPFAGEANGVRYIEGSCLLMRSAVARAFGPFDAVRFPRAYYEDSDLSARLTWGGYALAHLPHLPVAHRAGHSPTTTRVQAEFGAGQGGFDAVGQRTANRETFRARWHAPPAPPEIVLRRGGAIGDLLCCTPLLSALRQQNPEARIVFVTNNVNMFLGNPDLDDVRLDWCATPGVLEFIDRANPEPSMRWPSGVETHSAMHLIELFAALAGVELTAGRALTLKVFSHERAWARQYLPARYAVVSPHTTWHTKDWTRWAEFLPDFIAQSGLPVVLLGAGASYSLPPLEGGVPWRGPFQDSFPLAEQVLGADMDRVRAQLGPLVAAGLLRDWRGRTRLRQAIGAVAEAEAFVGLDSGLSHVAAAVGTSAVLLNGPVDARSTAHPGQRVLSTPLLCGGCYQRNKHPHIPWNDNRCSREEDGGNIPLLRRYPGLPKEGADCMAAISAASVLAACREHFEGIYGH